MKKPQNIIMAVNLLSASLALDLIRAFVGTIQIASQGKEFSFLPVMIVIVVVFAAAYGLLIYKISLGRDWARCMLAGLVALAIPSMIPAKCQLLVESPLAGVVDITSYGLMTYALVLCFAKPGNAWFGKHAPSTPSAS